ncbi:MAG: DHH family phosphoesterase [Candidatus Aenigmarchaeota archaeon]
MIEQLQKMINEAKRGKEWVKETKDQIRVVSHYDADGITSASIMVKTLLRYGKDFHMTIVKQMSEDILEKLAEEDRNLFIFLDMGSGQIDLIKKHLSSSRVIICDHHQPEGEADENIVHINSVVAGVEDNISGSGVTYILSRTIDPKNVDLSQLAVIGAIGDSQIDAIGPDWGVSGLNREILKDAESHGKIKVSKGLRLWGRYTRPLHKALSYSMDPHIPGITGSESASVQFLQDLGIPVKKGEDWRTIADLSMEEQKKLTDGIIKERIRGDHENPEYVFGDVYELLDKEGEFRDANEFATMLNACGKMDRANLGVSLCLNGKDAFEKVKKILGNYRREIGKGVGWLRSNIENPEIVKRRSGIYVLAGSNISEHLISNVISIINHSGLLPEKPLFGFADSEDGMKISARASDSLVEKGLKLNEIMGEISEKLGGEGGGHTGAAAAIIPKEKQDEFINMTEQILTNIGGEHGDKKQTEIERREEGNETGETGEGSDSGSEGRKNSDKKVEGKGLVQYFGS